MVVGLLLVEIHFPQSRSLKDKRRELSGLKDRLKSRFNVAVAEVDHQDTWQRAALGVATLSSGQAFVEQQIEAVLRDIRTHVNGDVLSAETRLY